MTDYLVIFEQAEDGGWGAYMPDLPGVVALGGSRDEAAERIQEALAAFADEMRSSGDSLPTPVHVAGTARA
ncbi:hypothetical protein BH20ACT15_BH20ACT15_12430 [soil metagenome]